MWLLRPTRVVVLAWALWVMVLPGAAHAGFLELEWNAPTTNADGTPLFDLRGYRLYVDESSPTCPSESFQAFDAPDPSPAPGATFAASLTNLIPGTTYFVRVSAVDFVGNESACTAEISGAAKVDLDVTPTSLSFDSVNLGQAPILNLTVENRSPRNLVGTATTVAASPFSIVSGGSFNIAPGASHTVRVRFTPLTVQTFAGNVNINTNGDDVSRPVTGTGVTNTPALLKFSQASYAVTEGGMATITVTRTGGAHGGVTVEYATGGGSATIDGDYTAASGTLSFAANQMSRTFTVSTRQDSLAEGPETVTLTLSDPAGGAVLGAPTASTLTITDNDVGGVLQFSAVAYTAEEAGGVFNVTVRRSGGAASNVTVDYAVIGGTASFGTDYTLPGGVTSGSLTFGVGEMSKVLPITVVNDTDLEGPETILLQLTSPSGGGILGAITAAVVTIDEAALVFAPAVYSVNEGGTATVTVMRTGPASQTATVDFTTGDGNGSSLAIQAVDFLTNAGTLTFPPGVRTRTFTVRTLPNAVKDGVRAAPLRLRAPNNAVLGTQNTAVVNIGDDDSGGTVRFGSATYTVSERTVTYNVPVSRSGGAAANVTVQYAVTGGTASFGTDYSLPGAAPTGILTFNAGQTTTMIPITIVNDTDVESDETIVLQLSGVTGGATLGAPATTTVTITDDDRTSTIQFGLAAYSASESAGSATITLVRTGALAVPVTVDFSTAAGTATPGLDYTATSRTVTFGTGQTTQTVNVPVTPNSGVDGARTVNLTLANARAPAALGARTSAVLTIQDDDSTLQFSAATASVTEGAPATITVTRTGSLAGTVAVPFLLTSGGTADSGVDFRLTPGVLTFTAGVAARTFTVQTLADAQVEGDETLVLSLGPPTGNATLGGTPTLTLTIVDAPQQIRFSAPAYTVSESTATATITVIRTSGVGQVTVDYASAGVTADAGDYTLPAGTLTFAPGQTARTFTLAIVNDTAIEGPETVMLTLSAPGGAVLGTPSTATLTILDNEAQVQFSAASYTATEGTIATITVTRSGPATAEATVNYAATGGTALGGGVDYTLAAGTLTFKPGQTSRTFTVAIVDDTEGEGPETVVLTLDTPVNAAIGPRGAATLTILDNEPQVRFSAAAYNVTEAAPAATVMVLRVGRTTGTVTVDYVVTGGTAAGGGIDFTLAAGTLTFGPGQTSRTFTVSIVNDALMEGPETVTLALGNPIGATLGTPNVATLTIVDNDVAGTVEFSSPVYSTVEGAGQAATVTVHRRGGAAGDVTVAFATADGSAVAPTHYTATSGTLTFGAGETTKTFSVPLADSSGPDAFRTVILTLSSPGGGATVGRSVATLFIVAGD